MNLTLIFVVCFSFLIEATNAICCDPLNNNTVRGDCSCSVQTGLVGICSCTNLPNSRQGWFCISDGVIEDSVSLFFKIT